MSLVLARSAPYTELSNYFAFIFKDGDFMFSTRALAGLKLCRDFVRVILSRMLKKRPLEAVTLSNRFAS